MEANDFLLLLFLLFCSLLLAVLLFWCCVWIKVKKRNNQELPLQLPLQPLHQLPPIRPDFLPELPGQSTHKLPPTAPPPYPGLPLSSNTGALQRIHPPSTSESVSQFGLKGGMGETRQAQQIDISSDEMDITVNHGGVQNGIQKITPPNLALHNP